MKIFITGATGFIGNRILSDLKEEGYWVRALVREGSELIIKNTREIETVNGDVTQLESIKGKLKGCDAVIHLVGIIRENPRRGVTFRKLHFEATKNIVDTAKDEGIRRFVHMSALGAGPQAASKYHQTKCLAEGYVKESGLEYTVFRPSIVFGPRDEFVNMLARTINKLPVFPIIGDGNYILQPIAVEDVSAAFTHSLSLNHTKRKTYEVGGVEKLTYVELVETIMEVLDKRRRMIHCPVWFIKRLASLLSAIPSFPITSDQLKMLVDENICDEREFLKDFDISPTLFRKGISKYLT